MYRALGAKTLRAAERCSEGLETGDRELGGDIRHATVTIKPRGLAWLGFHYVSYLSQLSQRGSDRYSYLDSCSRYRDCQLPLRRFDQLLIWRQFDEGLVLPTSANRTGQKTRPDRAVEAGWMDARPRSRAISALVQHAKAVFEECTDETALVAPISPSPAELIQTLVDVVSATLFENIMDITVLNVNTEICYI